MHFISLFLPVTTFLSLYLSLSLDFNKKDRMYVGNYQLFSFLLHGNKSILFYVIALQSFNYQVRDFIELLVRCHLFSFV